jgi:hypothetical protein
VSGLLGGHIVARIDGGIFGSITVRLRSGQVRVIRRGGGIENYEKSASRRAQVRLGAALAPLGPRGGSKEGLLLALAEGVIYGALDTVSHVLSNPIQGILYCAVVWRSGASRPGVGRRAKKRARKSGRSVHALPSRCNEFGARDTTSLQMRTIFQAAKRAREDSNL